MPKPAVDLVVGVRLGRDVIRRADALIPRLKHHADLKAVRASRALIIRLAVLRGLDALEAEYSR